MIMSKLNAIVLAVATVSAAASAFAVECSDWETSRAWRGIIQPIASDLYNLQQAELAKFGKKSFQRMNDAMLASLKTAPPSICEKRASHASFKEAQEIWKDAYNHPVASLRSIDKYDKTGGIGFCFGRALTTQTIANQRGLAPDSTLKIFAVGKMATETITWGFHVATLVRGPQEVVNGKAETQWYAIDPIFGDAMTVDEWVNTEMAGFNSDGLVRFYVTPSQKFGPNVGAYDKTAFGDSFYNEYFTDWMAQNKVLGQQCLKASARPAHSPAGCMPLKSWPEAVHFGYAREDAVRALEAGRRVRTRANAPAVASVEEVNTVTSHERDRASYSNFFRAMNGWLRPRTPTRR